MSSPYPGNPSPQQPQGGAPQGGEPQSGAPQSGSQPPSSGQWGSPPPPPSSAPGNGYPGAAGGTGAPAGPGVPAAGGAPYPAAGGGQPPQKKKPWPWIVGICGCLTLLALAAGGGGLALLSMNDGDDPTESPSAGPTSEQTTLEDPTDPATSDSPTSEAPTSEEPTSEAPTSAEPTGEEGLPGTTIYADTPVQDPTEADLDAAKEALLAYLMGLSDNDPAAACANQLDYMTGRGIDSSSGLYDICVESTQENIDGQELEGSVTGLSTADFEARLDAENRVILVHNIHSGDETQITVAKGSDGKLYVAL